MWYNKTTTFITQEASTLRPATQSKNNSHIVRKMPNLHWSLTKVPTQTSTVESIFMRAQILYLRSQSHYEYRTATKHKGQPTVDPTIVVIL